jgi:hypothetical protein
MTQFPGSYSAAFELNLTDRAEPVVGGEPTFLGKVEAVFHQIVQNQFRLKF